MIKHVDDRVKVRPPAFSMNTSSDFLLEGARLVVE